MLRPKSEIKSFTTYKKQELFDQLLSSLDAAEPSPFMWVGMRTFRREYGCKMGPPTPNEGDIKALTEPIRPGETFRSVRYEECWGWALENWQRVIPEAKKFLLDFATVHNQEFVEGVKKIEERKRTSPEKKAKGKS